MNTGRHIAYARISRAKITGTDSGDGQTSRYTTAPDQIAFMLENLPLDQFDATYMDQGVSAWTGKRRPDFEHMLTEIRDGDTIHVVEWARLFRDMFHQAEASKPLRDKHVTIDIDGRELHMWVPKDFAEAQRMGEAAWAYSDDLSRRIKRNRHNTRNGTNTRSKLGGRTPFGWNPDGTINEPKAALVRQGLNATINGATLDSVVRTFNQSGMPPSDNVAEWSRASVRHILDRPRNAGRYTHGGDRMTCPPIVDTDTQMRVTIILAERRKAHHKTGRDPVTLLAGRLSKCGTCGKPLTARTVRGKQVYHCVNYCKGVRTPVTNLNRQILYKLRAALRDAANKPAPDHGNLEVLQTIRDQVKAEQVAATIALANPNTDTDTLNRLLTGIRRRLTLAERDVADELARHGPRDLTDALKAATTGMTSIFTQDLAEQARVEGEEPDSDALEMEARDKAWFQWCDGQPLDVMRGLVSRFVPVVTVYSDGGYEFTDIE